MMDAIIPATKEIIVKIFFTSIFFEMYTESTSDVPIKEIVYPSPAIPIK